MTMLTYVLSPVPAPLIELILLPATDESPSLIEFIAFTKIPFGRLPPASRGVIDAAPPWCWIRLLSAKAADGSPCSRSDYNIGHLGTPLLCGPIRSQRDDKRAPPPAVAFVLGGRDQSGNDYDAAKQQNLENLLLI